MLEVQEYLVVFVFDDLYHHSSFSSSSGPAGSSANVRPFFVIYTHLCCAISTFDDEGDAVSVSMRASLHLLIESFAG